MTIKQVIDNGFCIGCGACKVAKPDSIDIKFVDSGYYKAKILDEKEMVNEVCPFSDESSSETDLGKNLYSKDNSNYDHRVGYYNNIYAGKVLSENARLESSSGGLTSWITEKLIYNNEVDVVVHVGESGELFAYKTSRSVEELMSKSNKKSRYYPVTYEEVLTKLKASKERIAFVGIPCFVKSIRLLQKEGYLTNVKFCLSLLCGHMKLAGFSESLAWQIGIKPNDLKMVDFRVKKENYLASNYFFEAENIRGTKVIARNGDLLGSNWGLGFFRHKACDFCDDIAGELADVTLGDAWLPKYTNDYLGTNILIVRNKVIQDLFKQYHEEIILEEVDVNTFYETQAGNYRNRRGGIIARLENNLSWTPKKRLDLCQEFKGNSKQNKIYRLRTELSRLSVKNFELSKKYNSILLFKILMLPVLVRYSYLMSGLKGSLKIIKIFKSIKTVRVSK